METDAIFEYRKQDSKWYYKDTEIERFQDGYLISIQYVAGDLINCTVSSTSALTFFLTRLFGRMPLFKCEEETCSIIK